VEFEAKRLCGVVKNKIAPPWKEAGFDVEWGQGISRAGDALDAAIEAGVVSQSGGYFWYNDDMIGHGRENAKQFLTEHPELFAELRAQVLGAQPEQQEGEA
jgi:recombination protein RecA